MSDYRLKIKIGEHEFEAEGPVEAVKAQFDSFKELISALPERKLQDSASMSLPELIANSTFPNAVIQPSRNYDRIFHADGRVVSLTVPPNSETDAVLLILFGQKHFRNNENPTGSEIMDGMAQSGYRMTRIDRVLATLSNEGAVIITGAHRGKRYRLTNQGFTRAEGIVRDALAKLP